MYEINQQGPLCLYVLLGVSLSSLGQVLGRTFIHTYGEASGFFLFLPLFLCVFPLFAIGNQTIFKTRKGPPTMNQLKNQTITEKMKSSAVSEFDAALAKLRLEFEQNLYSIDTLKKEDVERTLTLFNKRLVIFQYDFIKYLKSAFSEADSVSTCEFNFQTPSINSIETIYSSIVACGASILALSLISVPQTVFWVFTTTISLGALIGSSIGVSTGWATAGVGILAGAGAGVAVNLATRKARRKKIRNKLVKKYTEEVEPGLREWAVKAIDNISNQTDTI